MPPICCNERVKKVYARSFAIFSFLLDSFIHCLLSVGIWSYFTQHDVCRKSSSIFLSRWNTIYILPLRITLHPIVFLLILPILNIVFSSTFKHRTNWCLVCCFLCLIFCFQLIIPQHYNYDIRVGPIVWLSFFPVEQLYSNN